MSIEDIDTSVLIIDIIDMLYTHPKSISDFTMSFILDTPLEIIKDFMLILERNKLVRKTTKRTVMVWGLGKNGYWSESL